MKYFILLALMTSFTASAQDARCKPLDKLIEKVHSKKRYTYSSVNKLIQLSEQTKCDDGMYASSMSDIVVKALMRDFVRTVKMGAKDKKSSDFVLLHISSDAEANELSKIIENSKTICPKDKKEFCQKIAAAAETAKKS